MATTQQILEQVNAIEVQAGALSLLISKDELTQRDIHARAKLLENNIATLVAWTKEADE